MNAIIDPAGLVSEDSGMDDQHGTITFTLRRTGRKAVRFEGWQLVEAIGSNGSRPVWHDLNVYRTAKGCIVVELITRHGQPDHQEVSKVKTFEDLTTAAAWLEAYRCADDVPIPAGLGAVDIALPWAVLQSVQLRQSIDRLEADYHGLISEVFGALDLTDPAETHAAPINRKPAA
jgi:hypothetical protein